MGVRARWPILVHMREISRYAMLRAGTIFAIRAILMAAPTELTLAITAGVLEGAEL